MLKSYGLAVTLTAAPDVTPRPRLLSPTYAATTIGMFALVVFVGFEATAVTTVMPGVARELDGIGLYALAFAAPLASGVVGMVAAGARSDRRGPTGPFAAALVLFSVGLVVCGTAPSMEVLVAGRVLQGLGGGALTVCLYVMIGLVFPAVLQPAVFASFAAAWILPSLFGPALAAFVAAGRRLALGLPRRRRAGRGLHPADRAGAPRPRTPRRRQRDPALATGLGDRRGHRGARPRAGRLAQRQHRAARRARPRSGRLSLRRMLPAGSLVARRGLPAVIGTRGLLSASFFCSEAYIVFVLQDRWDLTPGTSGLALTAVGLTWAAASQVQSRLGSRVSDVTAMRWGIALVLTGTAALLLVILTHASPVLAVAAYVVSGAGMGFGYPRTGVAMLAASTDADRGFNSSALSISDSLGGALALSLSGIVFGLADRAGADPFASVFVLATGIAVLGLVTAARTGMAVETRETALDPAV